MTRILSLDDEPEMLQLLGLFVELAGYEHIRISNSHEALSILRCEPIDLLTQDCLRPDVHGMEFYQLLKSDESLRQIPVLFISAAIKPEFGDKCRADYGDDYLTKPFAPKDILAAVTGMMKRHGKHVPTKEERTARYKQIRGELKTKLGGLRWWMDLSEERLDDLFDRYFSFLSEIERNLQSWKGAA